MFSVFDLDPEQGLHLGEGEEGRQKNRRGRGRANSSCKRFCRLNTNSTIVPHRLITGKQNADLYTNVRDYYFPAVSYFPHLDYFCTTENLPRTNHKLPLRILPITLEQQITSTSLSERVLRTAGEVRNREPEDERASTLLNATEIVRNVSYVLPPSDSLSATSLLLPLPPPSSGLISALSLKRYSNENTNTSQREQKVSLLAEFFGLTASLRHLSKEQ